MSPGQASRWAGDGSVLTLAVLAREAEARGVEVRRYLAELGTEPSILWNPAGRVRREIALSFAERMIEVTGDPMFHVVATQNAFVGAFGLLDFIVTMGSTVGDGVRRVVPVYGLVNSGLRLSVREEPDAFVVDMEAVFEERPHFCDVETLIAAADRRARDATSGRHGLSSATLSLPDRGVRRQLEALLRCPVLYDAPRTTARYARACWETPSELAHPAILQAQGLLASPARALRERVADLVRAGLSSGQTTSARVAEQLEMSERSLHRRLSDEGESFREIVEGVRRALASQLRRDGMLTPSEIASLLGYSSVSAFQRAVRRWRGGRGSSS